MRRLRRDIDREIAAYLVERRDTSTGFERARMHARIQHLLPHGDVRVLEHAIGLVAIAHRPGEDVIRMPAWTMRARLLLADVLTDHRRIRLERPVRIDE